MVHQNLVFSSNSPKLAFPSKLLSKVKFYSYQVYSSRFIISFSKMAIDNSTILTLIQAVVFLTRPSLIGFAVADFGYCRGPNRVCTRRYVSSIMDELGLYYTLRAYRIPTVDSFWTLHRMIYPYMKCGKRKTTSESTKKNENNGAPNGVIPSTCRLSAAI